MKIKYYTSNFYSDECRFGFNGKEKDDEIKGTGNSLDFGARIYDPRIGRWLSLDPLMKKYPDVSPFSFCANNPIFWMDKGGREIWIGGDREKALVDLKSIVPDKYRPYLTASDEGKISLNVDKLHADGIVFDGNESGQNLMHDLIGSEKKFLYQVADKAKDYNSVCEKDKIYYLTQPGENGVQNSSKTKREPDYQGEKLENSNVLSPLPNEGTTSFDGIVTITSNKSFTLKGKDVRKNIVFHELKENLERTVNLKPYIDPKYDKKGFSLWRRDKFLEVIPDANDNGAHQSAVKAEENFYEPSSKPGEAVVK
ncbi:MAG: RHS repeat domain-containing protein [Bacteroidales bacterium]